MKNEIVLFETKDRDEKTIRKHINNVFDEDELDRENNTQKMRVDAVKQKVPFADGCKRIAASLFHMNL